MKYSIESIYFQAGQYDAYCLVEFYYGSNAHLKFGKSIHGMLVYDSEERKNLERKISLELSEIPFTDGFVRFNSSDNIEELLNEGFLVSEVERFATVGGIGPKVYGISNEKEIPNTILVPFSNRDSNLESWLLLELRNFNNRIEANNTLLPEEILRYNTIVYILKGEEEFPVELLDENSLTVKSDALFWILSHKYKNSLESGKLKITPEEYLQFRILLASRKTSRLEIVKRQLGISDKQLKEFENSSPDNYKEFIGLILRFEITAITFNYFSKPIYWDFDRYIHIFLRHYKSFFIRSSTKGQGTLFLYSYKNILNLIRIVIEHNKKDIEEAWLHGKEFRKSGRQSLYFNGNYFSIRINANGKLTQFHPQEY
ncbi:hypothetical protein [Pedobacter puniceum]|uniref:Uncharacterized protein n=1 Tax=Pedobacter puniceum TaxID=2666136 RepID=A0A7K0FKZ4_9SPHI|nr:hypothetical protein [Pedobacter puniceum]MRX46639.1 hypothetical protein [Pedobacter puniceum]